MIQFPLNRHKKDRHDGRPKYIKVEKQRAGTEAEDVGRVPALIVLRNGERQNFILEINDTFGGSL